MGFTKIQDIFLFLKKKQLDIPGQDGKKLDSKKNLDNLAINLDIFLKL